MQNFYLFTQLSMTKNTTETTEKFKEWLLLLLDGGRELRAIASERRLTHLDNQEEADRCN
jgi:hypothetical protein